MVPKWRLRLTASLDKASSAIIRPRPSIPFLHRFIAISRRIFAADGWTIDDREWMMELAHCRCLSLAKVIAEKADDNAMACHRVQWWFAVNSSNWKRHIKSPLVKLIRLQSQRPNMALMSKIWSGIKLICILRRFPLEQIATL